MTVANLCTYPAISLGPSLSIDLHQYYTRYLQYYSWYYIYVVVCCFQCCLGSAHEPFDVIDTASTPGEGDERQTTPCARRGRGTGWKERPWLGWSFGSGASGCHEEP